MVMVIMIVIKYLFKNNLYNKHCSITVSKSNECSLRLQNTCWKRDSDSKNFKSRQILKQKFYNVSEFKS